MNAALIALGYLGGYVNLALHLPRILATYRPRRDKRGKLRIEGVQPVVFTPAPDSSGALNHAMLRKFGNDLMGQHVAGHEQNKTTGKVEFAFRVFVPSNRAQWARDLFAYNGCEVDGMAGATQNARREHGLPRPWADSGGWAGLRARESSRVPTRKRRPATGKAATLARIGRWFED